MAGWETIQISTKDDRSRETGYLSGGRKPLTVWGTAVGTAAKLESSKACQGQGGGKAEWYNCRLARAAVKANSALGIQDQ